ncbi:MAG TPA: hypothetical protein VGK74_02555 [Symbiobacteriaceae bacterium]
MFILRLLDNKDQVSATHWRRVADKTTAIEDARKWVAESTGADPWAFVTDDGRENAGRTVFLIDRSREWSVEDLSQPVA